MVATNVQRVADATYDAVLDTVTLAPVKRRGAVISIDMGDAATQVVLFQREVGAPGSDVWEQLRSYTGVAVVADLYTTERDGEILRLFMRTDSGGGSTASLAEANRIDPTKSLHADDGSVLITVWENGEVEIPVAQVSKKVYNVTAAVAAADSPQHANARISLNNTTGFIYELPAATGSGDVYEFFIPLTVASGTMIIECTEGAAQFIGTLEVQDDESGIVSLADGSGDDFINMNGGTTGGEAGSYLRIMDTAVDIWLVSGVLRAASSEATPFAAS